MGEDEIENNRLIFCSQKGIPKQAKLRKKYKLKYFASKGASLLGEKEK
ncbi:MAG: hypothetical protein KHW52_05525 [Clostridium sp.]|nr:hypothetical protein [Clostridium sp.]